MRNALREALDKLVEEASPNDRETIRALSHAVALIITVDYHPEGNPETVKLTKASRSQLLDALGLEPSALLTEYRCTRSCPYASGNDSFYNPEGRQGYYIVARTMDIALLAMQRRFPNDRLAGRRGERPLFTAKVWKTKVYPGTVPVEDTKAFNDAGTEAWERSIL